MAREKKDSGIEWIGEIPKNWEIRKLKSVSEINSGEYISKEDYALEGTFDIIGSNGKIGEINKTNVSKKVITTGRVGSIGTSRIVQNAWVTDNALIIETKKNILLDYLAYIIPMFPYDIISTGTAQPLITATILKNQYIPYSTLCDQQKIADFLDEKCRELDNVIEKTHASIEEYKKLKNAVITQAVTKGIRNPREMKNSGIEWIGEMPVEWEERRVKTLFTLRDEKNFLPLEEVNLISLYTDLGVVQHSELEKTTGNKASNADGYKLVYKDDIVVNIILCWMGAIGRSEYNGVTSPAYDIYIPQNEVLSKFYHYYFRTKGFSGDCYKRGKGIMAMRWRTYSDQFRDIKVVHPSLEEQQEIVNYLDQKCSAIDELIAKKEQYLSEIENYKKSLIYEYVTGKREVQQNCQA